MRQSHTSGFTLIEITIVLGLIGVIAGFGATMSFSSLSRTAITQERDLFVTLLLRSTRSASIANLGETAHGVQIDNTNDRYILFSGTLYDETDPNNRVIPYVSDTITVSNTGGDTIVFEQLSGDVTVGAGTVVISRGTVAQEITIRESGQIDW